MIEIVLSALLATWLFAGPVLGGLLWLLLRERADPAPAPAALLARASRLFGDDPTGDEA